MTRKHFNEIARILFVTGASAQTISEMAIYFAEVNPSFDTTRFTVAATNKAV